MISNRILEARIAADREAVTLAHAAYPRLSPWELAALLRLDELTVRGHLAALDQEVAA